METAPKTQYPILVTGASGYFASELIKQLIEAGYSVRGTVRSKPDDEKYDWIRELGNDQSKIELVAANLLDEGAFDDACVGVEYVMHTASPYSFKVDDPQKDLVDPALQGTLNVLRSIAKANANAGEDGIKTKRLILTSSVGAVNVEPEKDRVYSEEDWNQQSSLDNNPYALSKTLAEQAAWKFVKELPDSQKFDMIAINPSTIIGKANHKSHIGNPSLDLVARVLAELPGVMKFSYYFVDVVDVAKAHILAMLKDDAKGRFICHGGTIWMEDLLKMVKARPGFEKYRVPKLKLSGHCTTWITKNVGSYMYPKQEKQYIQAQLGRWQAYDTTRIQKDLGLEFRPLQDTIFDAIDTLIENGRLKAPE